MQSPLERMYHAAKVDIPAEAAYLQRITNNLRGYLSDFDVASAEAGEPAVMTSMLHVGGDMLAVLRRAVTSLDNAADAVLITANDYRDTDDRARQDYQDLDQSLKSSPVPDHPTQSLPEPEKPGAELPAPPPGGPYPPGPIPTEPPRMDPNEDPPDPEDQREERGDGSENQPEVPEIDRPEWEDD